MHTNQTVRSNDVKEEEVYDKAMEHENLDVADGNLTQVTTLTEKCVKLNHHII